MRTEIGLDRFQTKLKWEIPVIKDEIIVMLSLINSFDNYRWMPRLDVFILVLAFALPAASTAPCASRT